MQLGGLPRPWSLSREAQDTFVSRKRQEALAPTTVAGRGEEEVQGTDAIMEDPGQDFRGLSLGDRSKSFLVL